MARTRSVKIYESAAELEELRQYFSGKPQARRLLFLIALAQNPKTTIKQAAIKCGISERRGRYWWGAYKENGLQGLLDRRGWKTDALPSESTARDGELGLKKSSESTGDISSNDLISFLNRLSTISKIPKTNEWIVALREALLAFIPDIDYAVISIRPDVNVVNPSKMENYQIYRQNVLPDGSVQRSAIASKEFTHGFENLINDGRTAGFPFEKYHFPPLGYDFYLEEGQRDRTTDGYHSFLGSILLFRNVKSAQISKETRGLIERIRPFLTYVISDHIVRLSLDRPSDQLFQYVLNRVAGDVGLTNREEQVLLLEMFGHSYQEVAEIMNVSHNTIQTHVRSIYRKAGVNKLSEFFAKYFIPKNLHSQRFEESDSDEDNDSFGR